jgi:hypothetical protein
LYASPNVIRGINSRRMRWAEHVARIGQLRKHTKFLSEHLKRRSHLGDLGVDERIIRYALKIVYENVD